MNKTILATMVFFAVTQAQALYCTLNRPSASQSGNYDQPVFKSPIEVLKNGAQSQLILVKTSGEVIENFDFTSLKTPRDLANIDKAIMATVGRSEDGVMMVGISGVDASNTSNFVSMYAMAVGGSGKFLGVIDSTHKLALTCF